MTSIFIDGKEGTTGLKIFDKIARYSNIDLLVLPEKHRKDILARQDMINQSDITFLCLPDDTAREAVSLRQNNTTKFIDASSAHRTHPDWCYGFPELSMLHREIIKRHNNISVPGCHASGFLAIVYPLIMQKIMPKDYPVTCQSITGYSGGGKKMIEEYASNNIAAPCQYALTKEHKHLKEMQGVAQLKYTPLFSPFVCSFYSGMEITIQLYSHLLNDSASAREVHNGLKTYYDKQKLIKVMPFVEEQNKKICADTLSGKNTMELYVSGNEKRINVVALYDNLGKGASGAALQCMNLMLGLSDDYNL